MGERLRFLQRADWETERDAELLKPAWQKAVLVKSMVDQFLDDPDQSASLLVKPYDQAELRSAFKNHPHIIAHHLVRRRKNVRRNFINTIEADDSAEINTLFASASLGKELTPEDEVLLCGDNPVALSFSVSQRDMRKLHTREIAGCYCSDGSWGSPLIFCTRDSFGDYSVSTFRHETYHGILDVISRATSDIDWGSNSHLFFKKIVDSHFIKNKSDEQLSRSEEWKNSVDWMLARAKDEILVRMLCDEEFYSAMTTRNNVYDLTTKLLPDGGDLQTRLWSSYQSELRPVLDLVYVVSYMYKNQLPVRHEMLPWLLVDAPINSWNRYLMRIGILGEIKALEMVNDRIAEVKNDEQGIFYQITKLAQNKNLSSMDVENALAATLAEKPEQLKTASLQKLLV